MRRYQSLRGRRAFALVLRRGRAVSTKGFVVFAFTPRTAQASTAKVGVVITKKVGKAVTRNRLRRRCKAILDQTMIADSRKWYVVQCRPAAAALPYAQLREQLSAAVKTSAAEAGNAPRRRETVRS